MNLNQSVLAALGLQDLKDVTHLTLRLSYDAPPTLTITKHLLKPMHDPEYKFEYYEIVEAKPLTIAEQCDAALKRVNDWIKNA